MDETEKIEKLEEDYAAMQETMYLSSVPGMRDKIIKGINTPLDECVEDNFL
jgi:PHD/YefM family antitoxin component YafN of YafNO toxin-antitoxin module